MIYLNFLNLKNNKYINIHKNILLFFIIYKNNYYLNLSNKKYEK